MSGLPERGLQTEDDPPEPEPSQLPTAVVLAAGRGTRMLSAHPKMLHPLCGRAIAAHVLHALADSGIRRAVAVVPGGNAGDEIRSGLDADLPDDLELNYAVQPEPVGTGDAVLRARSIVDADELLVVNGDLALLTEDQLRPLLTAPATDVAVLTATVAAPAQMGRIVRGADCRLRQIVEWRDANEAQRAICEVNVGVYRFRAQFLWDAMMDLSGQRTGTGERYVTDAIAIATAAGTAAAVEARLPEGKLNVENLLDAADAEAAIRRRIVKRLLAAGVRITDPAAVWIDARASISSGVTIEPGTHIRGRSSVDSGTRVGPAAVIDDSTVGAHSALESCTVRESSLGSYVEVGPYSTIRPGCEIADYVHIGTHAELKNAQLGEEVQVGHFSYVGDAELGARVNVGAGAITCNYDGAEKHMTRIGDDAFIGSDTMLIAPISIGARSRTGAGSVVTKDVPADTNVVGAPARIAPARRSIRRVHQPGREQSG